DRIEKAYRLITEGQGEPTSNFTATLKKQYGQNINDNHIEPLILVNEKNEPQGLVKDNDVVMFFNIREDRARQLTRALSRPDFNEFARREIKNVFYASLIPYEASLSPYVEVVFPPPELKYTLARILAASGKKQFKIAETEKYAHITYFFNGGQEEPAALEERKLIPSQPTARFDETPQMRAVEIGEALIETIKSSQYDFLLANLANADMLGHTGNFEATQKGIEAVDAVIGKIVQTVLEIDGGLIITSDHGNAEQMINLTSGEPYTEHTLNPVPFYLVTNAVKKTAPSTAPAEIKGLLPDVAATVLDLMGIPIPADMDGQTLLPILYRQQ
ncbi:MAG: alkaline phosphatase family protein, partial [Patescibacteria group bacterium]